MAKWNNDSIPDNGLAWIKTNMSHIHICKSSPTTYAQATASYNLGTAAHTVASSPGDWGSSGRQVTIPAKSSIKITTGGAMNTVAITKSSGSVLIAVTDLPASSKTSVSASDYVNTAAFNWRIADVTA